MKALFFCLLIFCIILFTPWFFYVSAQLNTKQKNLKVTVKLFNHITVYKNIFTLQGTKVINEKKKEEQKFGKSNAPRGMMKALTLTKALVVIFYSNENFVKALQYTGYANAFLCFIDTLLCAHGKNVCVSSEAVQGETVIIAEGIIRTTIANIIFVVIKGIGGKIWIQLKTKLKKS